MKLKLFLPIIVLPMCMMGQFTIMSGASFYSKGGTLVYSNENVTNSGILSFETGVLVIDKDFTNNSPNSTTTIGTPHLNLSRARLKVGSGNATSNVNQTLKFTDGIGAGVPSTVTGFNQVLHLEVDKTGGNVLVNRGMLHLTSTNPVTDGLATLKMTTPTVFNANDRVTMRSSSTTNTALVAESNNLAVVNNIVVEKFIPAKRGTRFLNSTVNGGSINANWQEGVFNTAHLPSNDPSWAAPTWTNAELPYDSNAVNKNPRPGYGTHITGVGGNGTDSQPSGNPSLFTFNNTSRAWVNVINTLGTNLDVNTPYRMVIRGDRSININFNGSTPTSTILRSKGSLKFGDVTHSENNSAVNGKIVFFTNPYQSIVDMNILKNSSNNTNISSCNCFLTYDATRNSNGAWVTVSNIDTGNGTNNVAGSEMNKFLQPGQSFFVTATTANPTLTFNENKRIVANQLTQIFNVESAKRIRFNLYKEQDLPDFSKAIAGGIIDFESNLSNDYDYYDAPGIANIDETIHSVSNDNTNCSLQRRNMPFDSEIINLNISRYRQQNYALRFNVEEFLGKDAFLKDNFLNSETPLEVGANVVYPFNVDSNVPASIAANRFDIVFRDNLSSINAGLNSSFVIYPNPNSIEVFYISTNGSVGQNVNIKIINMLGQLIDNVKVNVPADGTLEIKSSHLAEGVYNIILESDGNQVFNSKLIKNN